MVCSRGESLTLHISQMKLFNAIAAAAVIGASFVTAQAFDQVPGQNMGEVASEIYNLDRGTVQYRNDGDDTKYVVKNGRMGHTPYSTHRDSQVAHPFPSAPSGFESKEYKMGPRNFMEQQRNLDNGFVIGLS